MSRWTRRQPAASRSASGPDSVFHVVCASVHLTSLAMLAFAGNSVLCRLELSHTHIDPASFTAVRLLSGAAVLWVAARVRGGNPFCCGHWVLALAFLARV